MRNNYFTNNFRLNNHSICKITDSPELKKSKFKFTIQKKEKVNLFQKTVEPLTLPNSNHSSLKCLQKTSSRTSNKNIKKQSGEESNIFCINRKLRKQVLKDYPILKKFYFCSSKGGLIKIINNLPTQWKTLIKMYLRRFFLIHVHLRKMKNESEFKSYRTLFYEMLNDTELLKKNNKINNNIVKNFSKGIVNFVLMYYNQLKSSPVLKNSFKCH